MWHLVYAYPDGTFALVGIYATERIGKLFAESRSKKFRCPGRFIVERAGTHFQTACLRSY